jgi:hypothetical protein
VLKNDPDATIRLPTEDKMQQYAQATASKHACLGAQNVWCTIDGLKLMLQQAPSSTIQEQFNNGWTHNHYVTSVFCFCPDGTILIATFNMTGSFHDSTVAEYGDVYAKLEEMFDKYGVNCTADLAFGGEELVPYGESAGCIISARKIHMRAKLLGRS